MSTLLLAHDHWNGPGWWWPFIPLLWFGVIFTLIFFVARRRLYGWGPGWRDGMSVLDERYARGEITADEYRERRDVLREQGR